MNCQAGDDEYHNCPSPNISYDANHLIVFVQFVDIILLDTMALLYRLNNI